MQHFRKPQSYWDPLKHQRNFFLQLAKELNINPLKPQEWYNFEEELISEIKNRGGKFVNEQYQGNPFTALQVVFPELNFHSSIKFSNFSQLKTDSKQKRINFSSKVPNGKNLIEFQ